MSDDRFKEIFRRIVSESPQPPEFSDLDLLELTPRSALRFKPWMAAAGAAVLVMVLVGAFGLLGGGGPDLASPEDDGLIDYIKLEYSASVNPVCQGGEVIDNGGFDEATIEIWGPNEDDLTLMLSTFPDGSTERTVIEGDPWNPNRGWVKDPEGFPFNTEFRVVRCVGTDSDEVTLLSNVTETHFGATVPIFFLSPPDGTWSASLPRAGSRPEVWDGINVLVYPARYESDSVTQAVDFYVAEDDLTLLRQYGRMSSDVIGTVETDTAVVERDRVDPSVVSFSLSGLTPVDYNQTAELGREECPVTIPSQGFTPPDGYPPTPAAPDTLWFGKDDLWTYLSTKGSYDQRKSVWWSVNFPGGGMEPEPQIATSYVLLNAPHEVVLTSEIGTNAQTAEDGWFMIANIDPNYTGCWQVTAEYKGASLSYVYWSEFGLDSSVLGAVPDVVGMTASRARNVLHDALYEAAYIDSADPSYEVCAQEPGAGLEIKPGAIVGMRTAPVGSCRELMTPVGHDVPDVVGLTVAEARTVLAEAGYEASTSSGVAESAVVCQQDPGPGAESRGTPVFVKLDAAPTGEC